MRPIGAKPFEPCKARAVVEGGDTGRRIPKNPMRKTRTIRSAPGRSERKGAPIKEFAPESKAARISDVRLKARRPAARRPKASTSDKVRLITTA